MEWISVKNQLPHNNDNIICYNENDLSQGYISCKYGEFETHHPYTEQIGFYEDIYAYGELDGSEPVSVTHWFKILPCICKRIPELPK